GGRAAGRRVGRRPRLPHHAVARHPERGGHDGRARLARRHRHRDGAGYQAGRAPAAALAAGVPDGARVTRWTLALGAVLVLGAIAVSPSSWRARSGGSSWSWRATGS